jgi:hypothetical protein
MTKPLWDDDYLRSFSKALLTTGYENQFWTIDKDNEVEEFNDAHFRRLLRKFFPALGVWNLTLGEGTNGLPVRHLVFLREGKCQEIDADTLRVIFDIVLDFLGKLGDDIKSKMIRTGNKSSNPIFNKSTLNSHIPNLYGKSVFRDTATSAFRFFQNGWVEITADGVSSLRPYKDIPEEYVVWNSSVSSRQYTASESKSDMAEKLRRITADKIHPVTGETLYSKNDITRVWQQWKQKVDEWDGGDTDTHFKDYVENLSRMDDGEVDETTLERLQLAIGYLCHRHHVLSKQRAVVLVDKFYAGRSRNVSDGGTGKSILAKCLGGGLMNRTEVNGKKFEKGRHDLFPFGNVPLSCELVHIDDVTSKFDFEKFFNHITGDFEIRKMGRVDVIPAKSAPKMVICSNHPIPGEGNSYARRQFVIEVGNYYKVKDEEYGETPYELHGYKHLGTDEWNEGDWSEFYKYVFGCISLYLRKGGLPRGGESAEYKRQKLTASIGSEEVLDYLIAKLEEYADHGQEVFAEVFYKELRSAFPSETDDFSNTILWNWLGEVGKAVKKYPNKHKNGSLDKQRLTDERLARWNAEGMSDWKDKNGKVPQHGDRIQVFKVSSMKNPASMVSTPDFSNGGEE